MPFVSKIKIAVVGFAISFGIFSQAQANASIFGKDLFSGKNVTIESGKLGQVLIFMSAKCPCSNSHVQIIKKLSQQFSDFSFVVIHSNGDESLAEAQKYFKNADFKFGVIRDVDFKLADKFKAYKTPHSFVLDIAGNVLYKGGVTSSATADAADRIYLQEALNDISNNQPIKLAEGRTLGCAISRGKNVW
jgi:hypothetical protein